LSDATNLPTATSGPAGEEHRLLGDPRLAEAIHLFNRGEWYACHDGFEELWHETQGPCRPLLQGLLQVAVSQLHLERGNRHGATVLLGEGLGRLERCGDLDLNVDLVPLRDALRLWLQALQNDADTSVLAPPRLIWSPPVHG
jgi:predicted metal-dependent hydrolase